MKLFRKICLQVFLGMAMLAVGLLFFSAGEIKRQGLSQARGFGREQAERKLIQIREKNAEEKIAVLEKSIQDIIISSEVQEDFGSNGVLWRDGKELRNRSPYMLDQGLLEEMSEKGRVSEEGAYVGGPFRAGEKRLLVFYWKKADFGAGTDYSFAVFQDVTEIYSGMEKLFLYGACLVGGLLFLIGFLLWFRLYRLLRPLKELKDSAADIAAGEYGRRVQVQSRDEIGEVTASFNRMAEEVERYTDALKEVNEKQRQLLGSLAHEMKTPLTAMIGNADLLLTVRLKEEQREKALTYLLNESRRLSRLSEKMLELTGLYENGGAGAVMKETGLEKLFQRLEASVDWRFKEKQIILETEVSEEGLSHRMDGDLMESLLLNLVDNACKASEPGGRVLVSADEKGIYVEDFGSGIPAEEVRRVTEAFYMVDKARARGEGGSGLGLAVCQQIAEIHGAGLCIESREGKGTKVSILWDNIPGQITKRLQSEADSV